MQTFNRKGSSGLAGRSAAVGFAVQCTEPRPYFNAETDLLSSGDRGTNVEYLQMDLLDLGYDVGPIDGVYGPQTAGAVRAFQREAGVSADGIFGPQTAAALCAALEGRWSGGGGGSGNGSGSGGNQDTGGEGNQQNGGLFTTENLVYGGLGLATAFGVAAILSRD